jgi:hypothetical protein
VGIVDQDGEWRLTDPVTGGRLSFLYGNPVDVPFAGDWDCDGIATPGLYRRSTGQAFLRNSNSTGPADLTFMFGNPGDVPLAGDFDGDGCDSLSIYRPANSSVHIVHRLGRDGGGLGPADQTYVFGNPGDVPFAGDWDGDGADTVGLRRPSDGFVYMTDRHPPGPPTSMVIRAMSPSPGIGTATVPTASACIDPSPRPAISATRIRPAWPTGTFAGRVSRWPVISGCCPSHPRARLASFR